MGLFSKKTKEEEKKAKVKKPEGQLKAAPKKASQEPSKKVSDKKSSKKTDNKFGQAHRFLLRPIISEKATIGAADGKYTFEVSQNANKVSIKQAIEEVYGVEAVSINIINKSGRNVRFGRKFGRTKNVKKAIVTLKKGDSIKLYEGI